MLQHKTHEFGALILETKLILEFGDPEDHIRGPCMTLPVMGHKQVEAAAGDVVKKAVADIGYLMMMMMMKMRMKIDEDRS